MQSDFLVRVLFKLKILFTDSIINFQKWTSLNCVFKQNGQFSDINIADKILS